MKRPTDDLETIFGDEIAANDDLDEIFSDPPAPVQMGVGGSSSISFRDIVLANKKLGHTHRKQFLLTFGLNLDTYMHPLFGFEIMMFEKFVRPKREQSLKDAIIERWGKDAATLVHTLIEGAKK
jgi:hypothetical protein